MGKAQAGEVIPARRNRADHLPKGGRPGFHMHSPSYKAHLADKARAKGDLATIERAPLPVTGAGAENLAFHQLLTNQSVALTEIGEGAGEAARYLVAVAMGRKKGEQWRMTAARDVLDRVAATGATVSAAQQAQASAARADADLAPLLAKLLEARALAARKAGAVDVDATQQSPETGRISGTQAGD